MEINQLTHTLVGVAMEVHKTLDPGLLESAYEECLCRELVVQTILLANWPQCRRWSQKTRTLNIQSL